MYFMEYSALVHMAELVRFSPYELVPNISQYTQYIYNNI